MPYIYISAFHDHNTRQKDNIYLIIHSFAKDCLPCSIPRLIKSPPKIVSDKLYAHSYDSFKKYVKNHFIQRYPELCHMENVCNRNGV